MPLCEVCGFYVFVKSLKHFFTKSSCYFIQNMFLKNKPLKSKENCWLGFPLRCVQWKYTRYTQIYLQQL